MMYRLYQNVTLLGLLLVMVSPWTGPTLTSAKTTFEVITAENVRELSREYRQRNYSTDDARNDEYLVLEELPDNFDTIRDAERRKTFFQRIVLPLIYLENQRIKAERKRLQRIFSRTPAPDSVDASVISSGDRAFLRHLINRYDAGKGYAESEITEQQWKKLRRRVNTIPASLVLAQATNESGWGTSRYAIKGNNLFGVRSYDESTPGFKPRGLPDTSSFRVRKFSTLMGSVRHYMLTLNSHWAYEKFRVLRSKHSVEDPLKLVRGLSRYSERRDEYLTRLVRLIKWNDYRRFDE